MILDRNCCLCSKNITGARSYQPTAIVMRPIEILVLGGVPRQSFCLGRECCKHGIVDTELLSKLG